MTTTHNTNFGLVSLDPSDTVGSSINWYLTHDPVPCSDLADAFVANGLDPMDLPSETTALSRFRELCAYLSPRIYRPIAVGDRREFVCAKVDHGSEDKDLVSYSYSANFGRGREKSRLVQVGTLTFNKANGTFSWRFEFDRMNSGETLDGYVARGVVAFDGTGINADDLTFFAGFCHRLLSEVDVYASAPHYDICRLRDTLRDQFISAGCYSLSSRGGFWFAPRLDSDDGGPAGYVARVMAAYEEVSANNRFMLLTMPKDERTVETAASVVSEGLMARVSSVLDAIAKVSEMKRAGQHDTRLTELADVVEQAELYREMLGMTTDDLTARIAEARGMIESQANLFASEIATRKAEKEAAKKAAKEAEKAAETAEKVESAPVDITAITKAKVSVLRAAVRDGGLVVDGVALVVSKDPALGYTYTVEADGVVVDSGSATNAKAVVDSIRSFEAAAAA